MLSFYMCQTAPFELLSILCWSEQCARLQHRCSDWACRCRVQVAHPVASAALVAKIISGRHGGACSSRCGGRAVPAAHLLARRSGLVACILLASVWVILCRRRLLPCRRWLVRPSGVAVSWIPGPRCYRINSYMHMICDQPERKDGPQNMALSSSSASCRESKDMNREL